MNAPGDVPDVPDVPDAAAAPAPISAATRTLAFAAVSVLPLAISWVITLLWLLAVGDVARPTARGGWAVLPAWSLLTVPAALILAVWVQSRRWHPLAVTRNPWIAALPVTVAVTVGIAAAHAIGWGVGGLALGPMWLAFCGYPVALYFCAVIAFRAMPPR